MKIDQYKRLVEEVLKEIGLYSEEALDLMMGTAVHESAGLNYLRQLGNGPARSFLQVEPETAYDNVVNYLVYKQELRDKIWRTCSFPDEFMFRMINKKIEKQKLAEVLERNIAFSICMARVKYYRDSQPIPKDLKGHAEYWKRVYNSHLGAGTPEEYINNYYKYGLNEI